MNLTTVLQNTWLLHAFNYSATQLLSYYIHWTSVLNYYLVTTCIQLLCYTITWLQHALNYCASQLLRITMTTHCVRDKINDVPLIQLFICFGKSFPCLLNPISNRVRGNRIFFSNICRRIMFIDNLVWSNIGSAQHKTKIRKKWKITPPSPSQAYTEKGIKHF